MDLGDHVGEELFPFIRLDKGKLSVFSFDNGVSIALICDGDVYVLAGHDFTQVFGVPSLVGFPGRCCASDDKWAVCSDISHEFQGAGFLMEFVDALWV